MSANQTDEVNVLRLTRHGRLVGYLVGFNNNRNVLSFRGGGGRTAFGLILRKCYSLYINIAIIRQK